MVLRLCVVLASLFLLSSFGLWAIYVFLYRHIKGSDKNKKKVKYLKIGYYVVLICVAFGIVFAGTKGFIALAKNDSELDKIRVSESNPRKSTDEIFAYNDPNEVPYNEYEMMLHMNWMEENLSLSDYQQKMSGIYLVIPDKENMSFETLKEDDQKKIESYAIRISELQSKKRNGGILTEAEMMKEYILYWSSYKLRPTAEMAYQSGRAIEDLFWLQKEDRNAAIENAAKSILAFEDFMLYEDKTVDVGDRQRIVSRNEIIYRNMKLYYALGQVENNFDVKLHFYLCAYGCAYNIYGNGKIQDELDAYSLLGEYYKAMSLIKIYESYLKHNCLDKLDSNIYKEMITTISNIEMLSDIPELKREGENMDERIKEVQERMKSIVIIEQ